jgi:hypothetical protein
MRTTAISSLGLVAVLALAAAAAGTAGPFVGRISQGQTNTHRYDNNPSNNACIALATTYTVTLTYAPSTDVLTLSAFGKTAVGAAGTASVSGESGWCTEFDVTVGGALVGSAATYVVTVTRGSAAS